MSKVCDYENVASAVFSQPAIGVVGLNELEARNDHADDGGIEVLKPLSNL